ncbi:MAG: hypothetical protein Q8N96_07645 [Methylovulum sp.]|nr:hypothetical protein [Methylovulum sp.]
MPPRAIKSIKYRGQAIENHLPYTNHPDAPDNVPKTVREFNQSAVFKLVDEPLLANPRWITLSLADIIQQTEQPPGSVLDFGEVVAKDNQQPEAKPDAGAGSVQKNNNNCDFSGLLRIPEKVDDWFNVIDDMVRVFYTQQGKPPNGTQAWGQLWTTPPIGYLITTGTDKGEEDCLNMPCAGTLSRSAFNKRWKKYTANAH